MLQANPTSPTFGAYPASPICGWPKRGTPDYAAAVRSQVARLAAQHAASLAESPAPTARRILLVASCPRVRAAVERGVRDLPAVTLVVADTMAHGMAKFDVQSAALVLVDDMRRETLGGLMERLADRRVVLIADSVPRSGELPHRLAGVLARPLNPERVQRQLLSLLEGPE